MKRPLHYISFFLAGVILMLSACGNGKVDFVTTSSAEIVSDADTVQSGFTLPFSSSDSYNPYEAKTKQNQELALLMFDSLIKLDSEFNPVNCLANEIKLNDKQCIITLVSACFSDGTGLTAEDVTYSIKLAKASETKYKAQLDNVSSCSVADSRTVVINLNSADPYFINLLDFPIVKLNSISRKDENSRILPPIGCGRYILTTDENGAYCLEANRNYHLGAPSISHIELVNCPDDEALEHIIEVGGVSMAYSDLSEGMPKMTGKRVELPLNNMVYLGVNCNKGVLADKNIRQAISFALDREKIANNAYYGYAAPAGLFSPSWLVAKNIQSVDIAQKSDQSVAYLSNAGYNKKDSEGYYVGSSGKRLTLELLYNSDNSVRKASAELIQSQLKKCGIEIILTEKDFASYQSSLTNGVFDLYIGEVKLLNNMDVRALFNNSGACYGIPSETVCKDAFDSVYSGESDLSVALSEFSGELPFVPICYRCGVLVYSQSIDSVPEVSISDIYYSVNSLSAF